MLMNPMVIMMGVTVLIMFVFPKMMANMDPDQLKEMQQMQSSMGSGSLADMLNPDKAKEGAAKLADKSEGKSGKRAQRTG